MSFTISDKELRKNFSEKDLVPIHRSIKVGNQTLRLATLTQEKKSALVFIHGSPGSWNAFIEYFKDPRLYNRLDLLAVDRPGYGGSDRGRPVADLALQGELIHESLMRFNYDTIILVGHSLGGPIAARMVMDYPDHYHGLVLMAPSIDPLQEKYEWYRHWINTKLIGALTPKDFWTSNEEILPLQKQLMDMLPLWKNIQIPVTILHGTADNFVPVANVDFAKKMINESLLRVNLIEDTGHFIPWTHYEEMVLAITNMYEIVLR